MRKALIAGIVASALFAVGALAANLGVESDNLASGQDAVEACGTAEIEWTNPGTTVVTSGTTADWQTTSATVTFTGANCTDAVVDLAIGLDTSTASPPDGTIDTWKDASCSETSDLVYNCTFTATSVRQIVEVALLANGNEIRPA